MGRGCPIRRSGSQRVLASRPGFSQRATSFIASQCQGIHQMPLIRLIVLLRDFRRTQGQTLSCKTTNRFVKTHSPSSSQDLAAASPSPGNRPTKPAVLEGTLGSHISTMSNNSRSFRIAQRPGRSRTELCPSLIKIPNPTDAGGGERDRTDDLMLAKHALYQLSYTPGRPVFRGSGAEGLSGLVGQGGLEPPTSRLSSARSNQLSY
jgi:hypothetical protein